MSCAPAKGHPLCALHERTLHRRDLRLVTTWPSARQLSLDVYAEAYLGTLHHELTRALASHGSRSRSRLSLDSLERLCPDTTVGTARRAAREAASNAVLVHGVPSWGKLRRLIWERDRGVCQACGDPVDEWTVGYDLGHLRERMAGGLDTPDNLVVMCGPCNKVAKPVHHTIAEARAWLEEFRAGGFGLYGAMAHAALARLCADVEQQQGRPPTRAELLDHIRQAIQTTARLAVTTSAADDGDGDDSTRRTVAKALRALLAAESIVQTPSYAVPGT
jgi:hypothetical protein